MIIKKYLSLVLILFIFSTSLLGKEAPIPAKDKVIKQYILIGFKTGIKPAQINEIKEQAMALAKKTRTLKKVEWGKRADITDNTKDYGYCLIFEFKNDADFEIFQENPLRIELMGRIYPIAKKTLKFTYHVIK